MNLSYVLFLVLAVSLVPVFSSPLSKNEQAEYESDESNGKDYQSILVENRKFRAVLKILRAYLKDQLEQIDRLSYQDADDSKPLMDKRQLKSQGLMERLKNRMDQDIHRYGWD